MHNRTHECKPPLGMQAIRLGHEAWENSSDVLYNFYSSLYEYSRMTSTKSPSFCTTNFRASLTNLTACLPQSHDCSSCVSTRILAPPPIWLQKQIDLSAYEFAHSPTYDISLDSLTLPAPEAGDSVELIMLCGAPSSNVGLEGSNQSVLGKTELGLVLVGENADTYGLTRHQHPLK
jgi:hypothetical protein